MEFASWRRPGPIETSFAALLQRAMKGKLFPDIVHHYERCELETRAMIVADWMMTFYSEVLFRIRGDDESKEAQHVRERREMTDAAERSAEAVSTLSVASARSLKEHFEWALPRAERHRAKAQQNYDAFLAQRRELQRRFEATRLLQRAGRGKLWRVLLHVSRVTQRDGMTTRSQDWERCFGELLRARALVANAAYRKSITDCGVEFARRGASDERSSPELAEKLQRAQQKNKSGSGAVVAAVVPLNPAPWNWSIAMAEAQERQRIYGEFLIAAERLQRWTLWKRHIRDLVLKQQQIPRARVEFEMRRVWRTIECESIALSQRSHMHKEFIKSLAAKWQQYRRERAQLREELILKGVLPDSGVWDYDMQQPDFTFNSNNVWGSPTSPDGSPQKYDDDGDQPVSDKSSSASPASTIRAGGAAGDSNTAPSEKGSSIVQAFSPAWGDARHPKHGGAETDSELDGRPPVPDSWNPSEENSSMAGVEIASSTERPPVGPSGPGGPGGPGGAPGGGLLDALGKSFSRPNSAPNSQSNSRKNSPSTSNAANSRPASGNGHLRMQDSIVPFRGGGGGANLRMEDSLVPVSGGGGGGGGRPQSGGGQSNPFLRNGQPPSRPSSGSQPQPQPQPQQQHVSWAEPGRGPGPSADPTDPTDPDRLNAQDSVFAEIFEEKRKQQEKERRREERRGRREEKERRRVEREDRIALGMEEPGDADGEFDDEDLSDNASGMSSFDSDVSIRHRNHFWI